MCLRLSFTDLTDGGLEMADNRKATIFRKTTMDRIENPEQFDKYLRVTDPGVWVVLIAIFVFFVGLICWSVSGRIEMTVDATATVTDQRAIVTQSMQSVGNLNVDISDLAEGTALMIDGHRVLASRAKTDDEGVRVFYAYINLPDGNYDAKIVAESVSAISFLFGSNE